MMMMIVKIVTCCKTLQGLTGSILLAADLMIIIIIVVTMIIITIIIVMMIIITITLWKHRECWIIRRVRGM